MKLRKRSLLWMLGLVLTLSSCGGELSSQSISSEEDSSSSSFSNSENESSSSSVSEIQEKTMVSENELLASLRGSSYNDWIDSEKDFGLSDIASVGVDQAAMADVLYPVSPTGTVYDADQYNMGPSVGNNGRPLNTLLASLATVEGVKKIVFGPGVYHFSTTINLKNLSDIYLCGSVSGETSFIFDSWISIFNIDGCANIHINDITFDFDPSPTVGGTIVSFDETKKQIVLSIPHEFDLSDPLYNNGKISYGSYMEFVYSESAQAYLPDPNGNLLYNSTGDSISNISGGSYNPLTRELTLSFVSMRNPTIGAHVSVAFTMYQYTGFVITDSEAIYLESDTVYTTPGMTVRTVEVKNMYLNRFNVQLKPGSARLMTATADIIHCVGNYGDLLITNCIFENSHDDALNICSFYKTINSSLVHEIEASSASYDTNVGIEKGDTLVVYDPKNFNLLATYVAGNVTNSGLTYTVEISERISADLSGYLLGNATRNPDMQLHNNIIRNKRNRGILAQVRNSSITNNSFENIYHGAVSILAVYDVFHEALVPANIDVTGNKFLNNNQGNGLNGDVAVMVYGSEGTVTGTIQDITVTNNYFYQSHLSAVSFLGAGNCLTQDNLFDHVSLHPINSSYNAAVRILTSDHITVRHNITLFETLPISYNNIFLNENTQDILGIDNEVREGY